MERENEQVRVALITLEGGGISSVCYGLAWHLSKKGIPTTVFTETPHTKLEVEELNSHLDVVRFPLPDIPPKPLWFQIRSFRQLSKLLKDYTIIHGVSPDASMLYTFYKRKLNKPFVASIHSIPLSTARTYVTTPTSCWSCAGLAYHILEYPLHEIAIRRCLAISDHIVMCSFTVLNELRAYYKNLPKERISTIYNAVNLNEIESVKIKYCNSGEDSVSIVFAGRLFWLKGAVYLLKAFEVVRRKFKDVHLEIFGKGPEEHRITKFVSEKGLQDCVHVHGRIPHKDLVAEIKRSELVVVPSLYEAQPMIALEAMACKKPLVTFDLPFAREIIKNGHNGLLAQAKDVKDLSDKIQLLLSDKKLRLKLGRNAYDYVKREHNWDIQINKYMKVYRQVIE